MYSWEKTSWNSGAWISKNWVPCMSFKFLQRESRHFGSFRTEKVMLHPLALRKCYICDIPLYTCNTITHVKIPLNVRSVLYLKSCLLLCYFSSLTIYLTSDGYNICSYLFSIFLWAFNFHPQIYGNSNSEYSVM